MLGYRLQNWSSIEPAMSQRLNHSLFYHEKIDLHNCSVIYTERFHMCVENKFITPVRLLCSKIEECFHYLEYKTCLSYLFMYLF